MIHCQKLLGEKNRNHRSKPHRRRSTCPLGMLLCSTQTQKNSRRKISYALNQRLPEDIRIQLSEEVEPDFHPRYCDSEKTYEYRDLNRKFPRA